MAVTTAAARAPPVSRYCTSTATNTPSAGYPPFCIAPGCRAGGGGLAELLNAFITTELTIEHVAESGERTAPTILAIRARKRPLSTPV